MKSLALTCALLLSTIATLAQDRSTTTPPYNVRVQLHDDYDALNSSIINAVKAKISAKQNFNIVDKQELADIQLVIHCKFTADRASIGCATHSTYWYGGIPNPLTTEILVSTDVPTMVDLIIHDFDEDTTPASLAKELKWSQAQIAWIKSR